MYAHVRSLFRMNRLICFEGTNQPGSRGIHERGGNRCRGVSGSDRSGKGKSKKCFQCCLLQTFFPLATRRQSVRRSANPDIRTCLTILKFVLPGFMRSGVLHSTVGHCGAYILLRPHHLGTCADCTSRLGLVYLG